MCCGHIRGSQVIYRRLARRLESERPANSIHGAPIQARLPGAVAPYRANWRNYACRWNRRKAVLDQLRSTSVLTCSTGFGLRLDGVRQSIPAGWRHFCRHPGRAASDHAAAAQADGLSGVAVHPAAADRQPAAAAAAALAAAGAAVRGDRPVGAGAGPAERRLRRPFRAGSRPGLLGGRSARGRADRGRRVRAGLVAIRGDRGGRDRRPACCWRRSLPAAGRWPGARPCWAIRKRLSPRCW